MLGSFFFQCTSEFVFYKGEWEFGRVFCGWGWGVGWWGRGVVGVVLVVVVVGVVVVVVVGGVVVVGVGVVVVVVGGVVVVDTRVCWRTRVHSV